MSVSFTTAILTVPFLFLDLKHSSSIPAPQWEITRSASLMIGSSTLKSNIYMSKYCVEIG